jgi:ATP-dependent Clp protease adaptor protein ClpS
LAPTEVLEPVAREREHSQLAPRWRVILLDDPVTTFDFVVSVLQRVFHKPRSDALRVTREAHETGSALVTVTTLEDGEFRRDQVRSLARARGYPLSVTLEPEA